MRMIDMNERLPDYNGKFRQFLAAIIVNLVAVSNGIAVGWPSPIIPQLRSGTSPVTDSTMSEAGISWIGGLFCLGGLCMSPFVGRLVEGLGRKGFGYLSTGPMLLGWLLTLVASSHAWLYLGRFCFGVSGVMSTFLVPIYVSEIAGEDNRGLLGSLLVFAINVGILLAFVAGSYLSYAAFSLFSMLCPLLFLVTFFCLPETPVYLVRNDRLKQAARSLMFFTGGNEALVEKEMARLQSQVESNASNTKNPTLCDLLKDRATFRGLVISFGLLGGQQLCGIFAMISYAETIFKMSGSSLSPQASAIVIGAIQVFGSYLSTVLMERAGRRILVLVSCGGMFACHYVVGLFCLLQALGFDVAFISWVPVAALSLYMVTYCLGMGPVPFVIVSEVFRMDVSSFASTVCFVFLWGIAFLVIKMFGPMMELVGISGCFFLLGTFCACSFFFAYYLLPETKGRKREEIVEELAGVRRPESCYFENTYASAKDVSCKEFSGTDSV